MSKVIITESNYKQVFGRLKKFFNHDSLLTWHQFDCGMKKRIGHTIHFDGIAKLSIPAHTANVMHRIYRSKHHVSDTKFFSSILAVLMISITMTVSSRIFR